MSYQNGWALVQISTGQEIQSWIGAQYGECPAQPNPLILPNGDHVHCASADTPYGDYKLVAKISSDLPPDPGTAPPRLVAAAFNITIASGDVQAIGGAYNLVAALYMGVGQYMLLFLSPETDNAYVPQIIDGGMNIKVTEQATDYLMVEARASNGELTDPPQFGIQVYRF